MTLSNKVTSWFSSLFGSASSVPNVSEYQMVDLSPHDNDDDGELGNLNPKSVCDGDNVAEVVEPPATLLEEFKEQWKLSLPLILTLSLEFLPASISVAFVGKYTGALYIDASSYASRLSNIVGVSVGVGLCSALETLASQSHGAGNTKAIGFYLQQGFWVLGATMIPVSLALWNTEAILIAMTQPPEVAGLAGEFAVWLIPSTAFVYVYELLRRSMQAIGIITPFTIAALVGLIVQSATTWYLLAHTDIGFIGAAYARLIGQFSSIGSVFVYLLITGAHQEFWGGFDVSAANPLLWGDWFKMGVPGILQLGFEWWAFEIQVILCGWLTNPNANIAAYSILNQITVSTFMFYYGSATAASIRTGMLLGGGHGMAARRACIVGMIVNTVLGLVGGGILLVYWRPLVNLFVNESVDEDVYDLIGDVVFISAIYQVFDSVHSLFSGIFRSTGLQSVAAVITFVAFWIVSLPASYYFAFSLDMDVPLTGVLSGSAIGLCVATMLDIPYVFSRINWQTLAEDVNVERKTALH